MYHSVSDADGPTSIPVHVFSEQIAALAAADYHISTLEEISKWHAGKLELPERTAVITFDDGFLDFRDNAWPILEKHGFSAIVFLPTDHIGGAEKWDGANAPARPLMDWDDVRALAKSGARFGSHTLNHARLPMISPDELDRELRDSKARLSQELGEENRIFAPPYGATSAAVRQKIADYYDIAVGTGFARADRSSDRYDIPRIEMHYFRNAGVWRRYLEGRAEFYFHARRFARSMRNAIGR